MGSSIDLGNGGGHEWYQMDFGSVSLTSTSRRLCTLASSWRSMRLRTVSELKYHWKGEYKHILEEVLSVSTYRVICHPFQLLSTFSTVPRIVLVFIFILAPTYYGLRSTICRNRSCDISADTVIWFENQKLGSHLQLLFVASLSLLV